MTLDALAQLGPQARGIAVVHPTVTDAELKAMRARGVRGIRFTQFDPKTAATTLDMIEPLAKRVQPLGWHVQIHLRGDQIVGAATCCSGCRARSCSITSAGFRRLASTIRRSA